MNGWIVFAIILVLFLFGGYGGWIYYSRRQASRLGLAPPSLNPFNRSASAPSYPPGPAPAGIRGWFNTQVRRFKNRNNRTAAGAYEDSTIYDGPRGRGAASHRMDPDNTWDARVGNEALYEEQELGLHAPQGPNTAYGNTAYAGAASAPAFQEHNEPARGRSRTREYEEDGLRADDRSARNPFDDENAAASLRGVSPRPLDLQDTSYGGAAHAPAKGGRHSEENSPTERRSMFRENM